MDCLANEIRSTESNHCTVLCSTVRGEGEGGREKEREREREMYLEYYMKFL